MVKDGINERGLQQAHHDSWQGGCVCFSDSSLLPPLAPHPHHCPHSLWLTDAGEVAKECAGWSDERTRDRLALQKLGGLINRTFFSLFWGGARGRVHPSTQLISNLEDFCVQGPHMASHHRLTDAFVLSGGRGRRGAKGEGMGGAGRTPPCAGRDGVFTHAGISETERNETKTESGRVNSGG